MNENKITETILDYLEAENTDYGIMLEGEWGCGKTYYVKNELKQDVENKFAQKGGCKLFYVSLYGVNNEKEIYSRILQSQFKFLGNKAVKVGTSCLSKYLKEKLNFDIGLEVLSNFTAIGKNNLIVFDDLERIGNGILTNEVLGLINYFIEHENRKVLIVCNENKASDFKDIKEKTIRYSLKYSVSVSDIFEQILRGKCLNKDYKQYLIQEKDFIVEIFNRAGCRNLRTLIFVIDVYEKIYEKIKDIPFSDEISKELLRYLLVIAIEWKNGASEEYLSSVDKFKTYVNYSSFKENKDLGKKKIYIEKFFEKYQTYQSKWESFPCVKKYIFTGALNEEEFLKVLKLKVKYYLKTSENQPEVAVYKKLSDKDMLEDSEVLNLIAELMKYVDEGKYEVEILLQICNLLLTFHLLGISGFVFGPNYIERFKKSIEKCKKNHEYCPHLGAWGENDFGMPKDAWDIYKEVYNYARNVNFEVLCSDSAKLQELFFGKIEEKDKIWVEQFMNDRKNEKIFYGMNWDKVVEVLTGVSSSRACLMAKSIRFLFPEQSVLLENDRENIKTKLIPELGKFLNKEENKHILRKNQLGHLLKKAKEVDGGIF